MDGLATLGLLFAGLCAAVVVALVMRAAPKIMFVLWVLVAFFVPVWIGVSAGTFWAAITIVTILAIVACGASVRLSAVDGFVAAFAFLVIGAFALRSTSLSATVIAIVEWVIPYIWGRLVLARLEASFIVRGIAAATVAAAAFALIEFATGVNPFLLLPAQGPSFEVWGTLQNRAGFVRVEGAFGHSIALGATLAMGSAFVVASPWRPWWKVVLLAIVAGATVLTFSRIGLTTLVLAVALSIFTLPHITRATRVVVGVTGVVAGLIIVPFLGAVFLDAGQEAGGSAAYRGGLLDLLPLVQVFGSAPALDGVTIGGQYLGYYAGSIDNALLVVALRVGWIPTAILVVALVLAMLPIFRRGGSNPAVIAVITQIPALFAVAFITQYGMIFWFMVGLAVAYETRRRASLDDPGGLTESSPTGRERAGVAAWSATPR
ncbi:MAG: hypothetical protein ABWY03_02855 [Microbacterium sp.]